MALRNIGKQFSLLGLRQGASLKDAKESHRRLAVLHHPDKGGSPEKMKELNEAYAAVKAALSQREASAKNVKSSPSSHPRPSPPGTSDNRFKKVNRGHNTMNFTRVTIKKKPAIDIEDTAKLRNIHTLLKGMKEGDRHGPKLQATNASFWGKSFGRHGGKCADES
eukprot:TRINITY_DN6006_c1_g1_i1.p1 TRINITY_DN6006_c1_g1~~TRINITY_DN6006_c1_g1_i1.p1  ORF type:complete len:185 (+),score=42.67 TRINITY_DN6006_c1_g1_i1:62-556(+)